MNRFKSLRTSLPGLVLSISLLAIYLRTAAPGLTWANGGTDGGDLIAAAATGGVAHPTGYPLYLLLARLFQFLPVGSLAFRTNLFSAMATASMAVLVYGLVQNLSATFTGERHWQPALAAGFAIGLTPLIWSQAVITEVYGLHALVVILILYLYSKPAATAPPIANRLEIWRGLILGLATGNHVTTILLVPAVLVVGSVQRQVNSGRGWLRNFKLDRDSFLRQLGMFAAGLSIYLLLPLRASANPPVNWGNVVSLERFWWLISGQLYHSYYLQFSWTEIWDRVQSCAALLLQQFGLPGVALGLVGLMGFGRYSRVFILTIWTTVVFTLFAILYGSIDSYIYLIPTFISFAIWMGLGIEGLAALATRYSHPLRLLLSFGLLVYIAGRSMAYLPEVDASSDQRAETFGSEVLSAAPENAILFAEGDEAAFALWYFHFALGERPDLAVVVVDLLHFDWYQENLHSVYPSLVIPPPFPWPETIAIANPSRPACYVQYADDTMIDCSQDVRSP